MNILPAILFIFCLFFFSFNITKVPPGINYDEASIGYNAILIAQTLKDENGTRLPLFVKTLEGSDWKQPITLYSTAIFFRIFGPSYFGLRFVSVIFAAISAILLFTLLKRITSLKGAFLGVVVFITSPIIVIQSHLALENIAPLPFVITWLLMLEKWKTSQQNIYLIFSGLALGLSIFSYNGMRLVVPVLLAVTAGFIWLTKRDFRGLAIFTGVVLFFIIVLVALKNFYPGAIFGNYRPHLLQSYQEFLHPYISTFDLSFLFLKGDSTPYHSTGKHGLFLLAALPLFVMGLYNILKRKDNFHLFLVSCFFLAPLFYGMTGVSFRGSRLLVLVPLFAIISSFGLQQILEVKKIFIRKALMVILFVFLILNFGDFTAYYWNGYQVDARVAFPSSADIAFENLYYQSKKMGLKPVLETSVDAIDKINAKFFERVYFDYPLERWQNGKPLPSNSIILTQSSTLPLLEKEGFVNLNFKMPFYSLSYKRDN